MRRDELQNLRRDPERLYTRLNRMCGYAFRCAAYAARTSRPRASLLKWWNWKDRMLGA